MPNHPFILRTGVPALDGEWAVGTAVGGEPTWTAVPRPHHSPDSSGPPAGYAAAVADTLERLGYAGGGVVLAIPAADCLVAPVATGGLPRQDRKALAYRLEEQLPLAAEEFVADFVHAPDGPAVVERATGVCVRVEGLRQIVAELEAAGVAIRSIAPLTLLAVQGLDSDSDASPRIVVLPDDDGDACRCLSLVALDRGVPVGWARAAADDPSDVALRVALLAAELPSRPALEALGLDPEAVAGLPWPADGEAAVRRPVTTVLGGALRSAATALDGRRPPWVEFRRGPLAARDRLGPYRRPINLAVAAAAALFLAVAAVAFVRSARYQAAARADEAAVVADVRAAFPGWFADAAVDDVRAALAQERRATAAGGGRPAGLPGRAGRSALVTLLGVLGRLPPDLPLRVDRATFGESDFELNGQARGYEDVDRAAAAIRTGGLDVPPPQARRGPDGRWGFTLRGATAAVGR